MGRELLNFILAFIGCILMVIGLHQLNPAYLYIYAGVAFIGMSYALWEG